MGMTCVFLPVITKSIAPNLDDPILNNLRDKMSLEKQQKLFERNQIGLSIERV